jgi:hypothetical protein
MEKCEKEKEENKKNCEVKSKQQESYMKLKIKKHIPRRKTKNNISLAREGGREHRF